MGDILTGKKSLIVQNVQAPIQHEEDEGKVTASSPPKIKEKSQKQIKHASLRHEKERPIRSRRTSLSTQEPPGGSSTARQYLQRTRVRQRSERERRYSISNHSPIQERLKDSSVVTRGRERERSIQNHPELESDEDQYHRFRARKNSARPKERKYYRYSKERNRSNSSSQSKNNNGKPKPTKEDLLVLKEEIKRLRLEKMKREEEFNKTNREMNEIRTSLKSNQKFLLALKKDMVEKSARSISKSRRSIMSNTDTGITYSRSPVHVYPDFQRRPQYGKRN